MKFFRIPILPNDLAVFFKNLVKETISIRESRSIVRPDMIHLLLEAKKGRLQDSAMTKQDDTGFATVDESSYGMGHKKLPITEDLITAQALVFFLAGFEATSTTLSFLSYLLATHRDVQEKLQKEVDEVLLNSDRNSTYEELLKMKYLDQVISETLRMYPTAYILTRVNTKTYTIPAQQLNETNLTLDPGTTVTLPIIGLHMDPEYFPNPNKFNPDRFSDVNKAKIVPGSFMPFGSGPRNCIGMFDLELKFYLIIHLFQGPDLLFLR